MKTGLKYLGQTKNDPNTYKGSGKYWTRHLKTHGDHHTTQILLETTDTEKLKESGLYYSRIWNIQESEEWANLKDEAGIEGGCLSEGSKDLISKANKGRKRPDRTSKTFTSEWRNNISRSNTGKPAWNKGLPRSIETKRKISETRKARSCDPLWNVMPPCSKEKARKIQQSNLGKKWIYDPTQIGIRLQLNQCDCEPYISKGWLYGFGSRKSIP